MITDEFMIGVEPKALLVNLHKRLMEMQFRQTNLENRILRLETAIAQEPEPEPEPEIPFVNPILESDLDEEAMITQEGYLTLSGTRPEVLRQWFATPCGHFTTLLAIVRSVTKDPIKRKQGGQNRFFTTVRTYRILADYLKDKTPGKRVSNVDLVSYAINVKNGQNV